MPLRLEMLTAPAWAAVPVPLRRILERLEVEHLKHGGKDNGYLRVDYSQFVDCGVAVNGAKTLRTMPKHQVSTANFGRAWRIKLVSAALLSISFPSP